MKSLNTPNQPLFLLTEEFIHVLTPTEINYGVLRPKKHEKDYFKSLPERFEMIIHGTKIYERKIQSHKIWMGHTIMDQFNPYDKITISITDNVVELS